MNFLFSAKITASNSWYEASDFFTNLPLVSSVYIKCGHSNNSKDSGILTLKLLKGYFDKTRAFQK